MSSMPKKCAKGIEKHCNITAGKGGAHVNYLTELGSLMYDNTSNLVDLVLINRIYNYIDNLKFQNECSAVRSTKSATVQE